MGRKKKVALAAPVEWTPELMKRHWESIIEWSIDRYKLGDNELRMLMDDALTRAGVVWEIRYNVKKLEKMSLSRFTPKTFKNFVHAFQRALSILVEAKTGYSATPFRTSRPTPAVETTERVESKPTTTKPRLRRSYSKRLRVSK